MAPSTSVLGHGLHCLFSGDVRFHLHPPPAELRFSCKLSSKKSSSHGRPQRAKKVPQRRPPLGTNLPSNNEESSKFQRALPDKALHSHQDVKSNASGDSDVVIGNHNGADIDNSKFSMRTQSLSEITNEGEQLVTSQLEDIVTTIRKRIKNALLIKEAHIHVLEDLDKILNDKKALQGKINILEKIVAETNSSIEIATEEKKHVEFLEYYLQKLKNEIFERDQSGKSRKKKSGEDASDMGNFFENEGKRRVQDEHLEDMPSEFWSHLLLTIDGWALEKKLSCNDARVLRDMAWNRDARLRNACLASKDKCEHEALATYIKLMPPQKRNHFHVIHIAVEMAPVAKVGGLGDVVTGLCKALQKRGHLVEIVLPKYDCVTHELINDLKALDIVVRSYFDGQLFKNRVWVGTVEGEDVYFLEPHHPAKFFMRGKLYGEPDDFKRFSYFSRAALELILQANKTPDIIHCHDWHTSFVAPLYWDSYAQNGLGSASICFTCHNFEYQGTAHASELASCGLNSRQLIVPDKMQDNGARDRVNPIKGAIVFSDVVVTVSPTYAQEVQTEQGGHGLHIALNSHSHKFVGILNGIDTDVWDPSTDAFLRFQYSADDLQGKEKNKDAIRKQLKLSSDGALRPLVGCVTRLVPQKGLRLIRHAIYQTLELGGQFILLGSSPIPNIQREFENISNHFESSHHARLILRYDEALAHTIYAASDLFIIPSIFEPCGLTQMIAMRYGSVPIVRRTGGLNDSVFDIEDFTIPHNLRNGYTFMNPDEMGVNSAMERAFNHYKVHQESWQQLVQRIMRLDFSWDSSAAQYEELYDAVAKTGA